MNRLTKSPEEYLKGPYARVLIPDSETGTYTARILEFPGCVTQGDSEQEALVRLEEVAESWIEACLDTGKPIPQPVAAQEYNGKVALRLPRSLHQQAVEAAECDRVSLNQFLVSAIAEKIGAAKAQQRQGTAANFFVADTTINILKMPPIVWSPFLPSMLFSDVAGAPIGHSLEPTTAIAIPALEGEKVPALEGEKENG
jgi:predicted RNase H-like HicB family nuclease